LEDRASALFDALAAPRVKRALFRALEERL
jgi:hypothetical protein